MSETGMNFAADLVRLIKEEFGDYFVICVAGEYFVVVVLVGCFPLFRNVGWGVGGLELNNYDIRCDCE